MVTRAEEQELLARCLAVRPAVGRHPAWIRNLQRAPISRSTSLMVDPLFSQPGVTSLLGRQRGFMWWRRQRGFKWRRRHFCCKREVYAYFSVERMTAWVVDKVQ